MFPCSIGVEQFKGYTREAVTICSFRSNMPRASHQAQKDPQAKKCVDEPGNGEALVEVGDLPVPRAEHPERVEDDGHAGEPHDGVHRLERRLHAAPHHPPRHAAAAAAAVTNPCKSQDQLRPLFFLLVLPSLGPRCRRLGMVLLFVERRSKRWSQQQLVWEKRRPGVGVVLLRRNDRNPVNI
jgi:hypothetical protein